ncbi:MULTISPECIES: RagB/SusD family nutrient uptake outer membrane protein [Flavobacteriaceae]|uniref:RagB/SusD family nutrient uptake outer membrane protein n=1 Tax=Flavobacteriaceae TaxID=49546 RepID=UPI0014928ED6|nr:MULTISPECIES: RagB/SusD family nutrient uptake outer membrane protein [Allomuricauda]MDC6367313.1 RagB/SusD family nutrient uptake outer membrane protein [Muricauda sp. AC10]
MKKNHFILLIFSVLIIVLSSCSDDLENIDTNNLNSENVFDNPETYLQFLAKLYAGLDQTGQEAPEGQPDLIGFTEGITSYIRLWWNLNELPADELKWRYNEPGIIDMVNHSWTQDNDYFSVMYSRIYFQIGQANEFLRQTAPNVLDERGITGELRGQIEGYRDEARFLRALAYYHTLDFFGGNVPFVTESDPPGAFLPQQTNGSVLFDFIESELQAIENTIAPPRQNGYGRADKGAVWTLLAKLYLNAEAFTGEARYADCLEYCNLIINDGTYALEPIYANVFRADNNRSDEIIFPVTFDGVQSQSFGVMYSLTNGVLDVNILESEPGAFGTNLNAFAALTCKESFVNLFEFENNDPFLDSPDVRASFLYKDGHSVDLPSEPIGSAFQEGFGYTKFRNVTSDGVPGEGGQFADVDFPLFRLADVYLMYAEAFLRGGGGSESQALDLVNAIRERAYGDATGNISTLTLEFIIDERARELGWEGKRRTDLIRFGRFTGNTYLWDWKGGVQNGVSIDGHLAIYPIPAFDISVNPNLEQNPGY